MLNIPQKSWNGFFSFIDDSKYKNIGVKLIPFSLNCRCALSLLFAFIFVYFLVFLKIREASQATPIEVISMVDNPLISCQGEARFTLVSMGLLFSDVA